jgi:hypothetical protein
VTSCGASSLAVQFAFELVVSMLSKGFRFPIIGKDTESPTWMN